jgi:Mn-dependent DtxR family transcriptional regulator
MKPARPPRRSRTVTLSHGLSEQTEDYLERIQELIDRKGYARVSDIAEALKITPSTVSSMVRRLARGGFIQFENYRGLSLTLAGRSVAARIQERHRILTEFLESLGLESSVVRHDVEGIEHHVSPTTLEALRKLTVERRRSMRRSKAT